MNEMIATLEVLRPALCSRTMNQLIVIVEAMLAMTGRVTMLGISRWIEKGGSYRTLQRFFKEEHDWAQLRWLLIKQHFEIKEHARIKSCNLKFKMGQLIIGDQ